MQHNVNSGEQVYKTSKESSIEIDKIFFIKIIIKDVNVIILG